MLDIILKIVYNKIENKERAQGARVGKDMKSRLLENWIKELKEEQKNYYNENKNIYNALKELGIEVYETTGRIIREETNKLELDVTHEQYKQAYVNAVDRLNEIGIKYDKEHFIRTLNNGTPYEIEFEGQTLYSYFEHYTREGYKARTYSIAQYYFKNNKTLYAKLESGKDLNELAEKEIELYVKQLLQRIEKKYGEAISVRDSCLSNIEQVIFKCEKGNCYLERITAGGYNIQVLHNRILVKELKQGVGTPPRKIIRRIKKWT